MENYSDSQKVREVVEVGERYVVRASVSSADTNDTAVGNGILLSGYNKALVAIDFNSSSDSAVLTPILKMSAGGSWYSGEPITVSAGSFPIGTAVFQELDFGAAYAVSFRVTSLTGTILSIAITPVN